MVTPILIPILAVKGLVGLVVYVILVPKLGIICPAIHIVQGSVHNGGCSVAGGPIVFEFSVVVDRDRYKWFKSYSLNKQWSRTGPHRYWSYSIDCSHSRSNNWDRSVCLL